MFIYNELLIFSALVGIYIYICLIIRSVRSITFKHKKVYLHDILDACTIITGKSISVKEIDLPVTDTNEPFH